MGAALILAGLAGATTAQGAPLTATATGSASGLTCPAAAPCTLFRALAVAVSGDVVTLAAGDHALPASAAVKEGVRLQGAPGPRPTITAPAAGGPALSVGGIGGIPVPGAPASVSHVRIVSPNPGATLQLGRGSSAEGLVVETTGADSGAVLVVAGGATLRSSLIVARGTGGTAALMVQSTPSVVLSTSASAQVRNVTAIATSPLGRGVLVSAPTASGITPGSCSNPFAGFGLRNVIARGGAADLQLIASGPCKGTARLDVDHSNFRTVSVEAATVDSPASAVTNGFNNQTSAAETADAAVFADAAYHQAASSPTIDAGVADLLPPTDIDGEPIPMRAGPDIGADEIAPATPAAPPAPVAVPAATPSLRLYSGIVVPRRVRLGTLLAKGLRVSLTLEQARSSYRLTLTAPARGLRAARSDAVLRRTLGTARAGNQAAGGVSATVRLPRTAARALRSARTLPRLTLRVRVTAPGGVSQTSTRTIIVVR